MFRFLLPRPRRLLSSLWLVLAACALAFGALAQTEDSLATARQQLDEVEARLSKIQRGLDKTESTEQFLELLDGSGRAQRDAQAVSQALAAPLADARSRLDQLGPVPQGVRESSDIASQRRELTRRWNQLDETRKRAELLALDARQLTETVERQRSQSFGERLSLRATSPLSPGLWRQVRQQAPADRDRLVAVQARLGQSLKAAVAEQGYGALAGGLIVALLLAFPARSLLQAFGRRRITARGPGGRLRRSALALWLTVAGTVTVGVAAAVLLGTLQSLGALNGFEAIADGFVQTSSVAAFIVALSGALMSRNQPSWRLFNLDDASAQRLLWHCYAAAGLIWLRYLATGLLKMAGVSAALSGALDGVATLFYGGLVLSALAGLSRSLRHVDPPAEDADPKAVNSAPRPPQRKLTTRGGGVIVLVRLLGYVAVCAALLAAVLGYLNLALFLVRQIIWVALVWGTIGLLMMFVDDWFGWLVRPDTRLCRAVVGVGVRPSLLAQAGALGSAALRVSLVMIGVALLLVPYGSNLTLFGNGLAALEDGLVLGQIKIQPGAILSALAVAAVGFAILQVVQRWLMRTYLPKTELDVGARASVSTAVRYLGIFVVVLWTLAALGITSQNLALLASALSVGIGFGLQAITQNFISGLILMAERPVKVGDWIRLGDQEGDIQRISVRATEIQIGDRSTLIVPNSELITKSVRNMTRSNPLGRVQLQFSVPLGTDMARVRALLLELYAAHPKTLSNPAPSVFIDSIASGQANFNSFLYVGSPRDAYGVRSDLFFALLKRMAEEGIALSSPQDIRVLPLPGAPAQAGDAAAAEGTTVPGTQA